MNLDKSRIDTLEHHVQPLRGVVIKLPVGGVGVDGICVYVVADPANPVLGGQKYTDVIRNLKSIAANLTL